MQEELKGQLAEASGFGELPQLFAEAYQIQTGGSLKGAEARAALMKAMEDGLVKADILPIVTKLMNELSKGGIEKARTSSVAEQERSKNMQTRMLESFSKAGGETGFARLWRTATDAMREMDRVMPNIGQIFDKGTYFFRQLILLPQSIGRMFSGRDSNFQKWLFGQGETGETIMQMMFNMGDILKEIGELGGKSYKGWKMLFDLFKDSGALQTVLDILKTIQESLLETLKAINKLASGDFSGAGDILKQALTNFSPAGIVGKGLNKIIPYPTSEPQDTLLDYQAKRYTAINTPASGYYGWTPEMYDENARNMAQDMAREAMLESNMSGGNQSPAGVMKVEVKLDANITAEKSEDVANTFVKMLDDKLQQTLTSYGYSGAQ